MDLEHHQLILRYEHLRLRCPERERRLLASLAEHGQQMPIVVVAASAETDRFVVVDGYKRAPWPAAPRRDCARGPGVHLAPAQREDLAESFHHAERGVGPSGSSDAQGD